jgi:hypothetical protein
MNLSLFMTAQFLAGAEAVNKELITQLSPTCFKNFLFASSIVPMDRQTRAIILWLSLSLSYLVFGQGQCYFPPEIDGQLGFQATEQKPCDAFAAVTLCCPLGWTCFSNKMCVVTDSSAVGDMWPLGTALRGTCTNPEWDNTACGGFCLSKFIL